MSLFTLTQLHTDLEKLAMANPDHLVKPGMIAAFNAHLTEAKGKYANHGVLASVSAADKNVRLSDMLVCVGQVMAVEQENAPPIESISW